MVKEEKHKQIYANILQMDDDDDHNVIRVVDTEDSPHHVTRQHKTNKTNRSDRDTPQRHYPIVPFDEENESDEVVVEEEEGESTSVPNSSNNSKHNRNRKRRDSFNLKRNPRDSQELDREHYQSTSIHPGAYSPFGTTSAWDQIHSE